VITLEGLKNVISQGLITFRESRFRMYALTNALKQAEIDQRVDEGVEIGDGIAIADMRAFNAEGDCLAIDAFRCRALVVGFLVE
jgi:hypothetical protein